MKRTLVIFSMMVFLGNSYSQMKPEAGTIGFSFDVTGLAAVTFNNFGASAISGQPIADPGTTGLLPATVDALVPQSMLFGRYYISSSMAIRAGLGINSMNTKTNDVDSTGNPGQIMTTDMSMGAFSFGLNAGIEKHFATSAAKLDPYAGAQISFAMLGKINAESVANTSDQTTTPVVFGDVTTVTHEWDGGTGFGLDLIAGFNYFFSDFFALGAETSWGFGSAGVGGAWTMNTHVDLNDPAVTDPVDVSDRAEFKVSTSGFRVAATGGIYASIFF